MNFKRTPVLFFKLSVCLCLIALCFVLFQRIGSAGAVVDHVKKMVISNRHCEPHKNIVFLKTHKSAGTAVQNILLRYADAHNLTVVLPPSSHLFTGPFSAQSMSHMPWAILKYNILCHHVVYNDTAIRSIMPPDAFFVTIIRDPVDAFESLYEYNNYRELLKLTIEEFALATLNKTRIKQLIPRLGRNALFRNMMLHDLGYNGTDLQRFIELLDRRFRLVMLAEFFDESLVMLRNLLCWSEDDVLGFSVNSRGSGYRWKLSKRARDLLDKWNYKDRLLYNHFASKFARERKIYGEMLQADVHSLRERRKLWYDFCVQGMVPSGKSTRHKYWTPKVMAFKLRRENGTCNAMVKPEIEQTEDIRQKQLLRAMSLR